MVGPSWTQRRHRAREVEIVISTALANFRDLGGLLTEDGRRTLPGILYRSDAPQPGDGRPPAAPVWPPALVLDLRSVDEPVHPHPLSADGTRVQLLPVLDRARPEAIADSNAVHEFSMVELYAAMTDLIGRLIGDALELAVNSQGPVLVHCAAGKDRTGVMVAVLLRAAGVIPEAIVADYALTTTRMPAVQRRLGLPPARAAAIAADYPHALIAPPEAVEAVLQIVDGSAGGTTGWLADHGVDSELVNRWRDRLLGPR